MDNLSIEVKVLFKKYPSIEIYYKAVLNAKGEDKAKEYLENCLNKYSLSKLK